MILERPAVLVALLTPFDASGDVDAAALRAHVAWLIDRGVDGFMPCGTTGESALLTDDEVIGIVEAVVAAAAGRVPVVAHVGRPGTAATIALGRRALAAGAAAISAVVPYYYPLDAEQVFAHYDGLIDAFGSGRVLAYNIPSHSPNDLDASTVARLAAAGLAGMKDSTMSLERQREYLAAVRDSDFATFVGASKLFLEALRAGAAGAVFAVANLHPEQCARVRDAFRAGDDAAADAAQAELTRAQAAIVGLPALKLAVAERLRAELQIDYAPALRAPLGPALQRVAESASP